MIFDYQAEDIHVNTRQHLPQLILANLQGGDRTEWVSHQNFNGLASFWLNIHQHIRQSSMQLSQGMQTLLDSSEGVSHDIVTMKGLQQSGYALINLAHNHHHIEDTQFFPQIAKSQPKLAEAMALLDGDHRVLEETLEAADAALKNLSSELMDRDKLAQATESAIALHGLISRHLVDEEEIVIPTLLQFY